MAHSSPLIDLAQWKDVLETEYLDEFICSGGAAVKFVTAENNVLDAAVSSIRDAAERRGYYYSFVDPSKPTSDGKNPGLHRIDRLFFEITRDVGWKRWASEQARDYLANAGIGVPPDCEIGDLDRVAQYNGRDAQDLLNQYQREFATPQLRDPRLSIEFRAAITALGRAQLIPDALTPTTEHVLLEWLRGRTVPGGPAALKQVRIFERINIAGARAMLTSFCRWLPHTGHAGLVVILDFRPYEYKRVNKSKRQEEQLRQYEEAIADGRSAAELAELRAANVQAEPAIAYSDAAYTQMLTILRRFIDEVDTFDNMLLVVLTTPDFYKDKTVDASVKRCYFDYDALQTRIGQEVHDLQHANPAASLVHLGGAK